MIARLTILPRLTTLGLLVLIAGCAAHKAGSRGPAQRLAVFETRTQKVRLVAKQRQALHDLAIRLFELTGAFRPIPLEQLTKALARRRRSSERRCHSFRCQARLAPRLFAAQRSVAVTIRERLLSQCEVTARLFDLSRRSVAYSARATASCNLEDLVRSVSQVVCHISAARLRGQTPNNHAVPKRRRPLPPAPPAQATARCLARGQLAWLEAELEAWARQRPRRGEDPASLAERALELRRKFEQLARQTPAQVAVPALCRVGTVYERLAERIARSDAQAPAEARERRTEPFRAQARKLYRSCLIKAEAKKIRGPAIELARERSNRR